MKRSKRKISKSNLSILHHHVVWFTASVVVVLFGIFILQSLHLLQISIGNTYSTIANAISDPTGATGVGGATGPSGSIGPTANPTTPPLVLYTYAIFDPTQATFVFPPFAPGPYSVAISSDPAMSNKNSKTIIKNASSMPIVIPMTNSSYGNVPCNGVRYFQVTSKNGAKSQIGQGKYNCFTVSVGISSATLSQSQATFQYAYNNSSTMLVNLFATGNPFNGGFEQYGSFGSNTASPITVNNPTTIWPYYSCGRLIHYYFSPYPNPLINGVLVRSVTGSAYVQC